MKKILLASVATIALCSASAFAADVPARGPVYKAAPAPVFNWSGFYWGGSVGAAWGRERVTDIDAYAAAAPAGTVTKLHETGFFGGGQAGYNVQSGAWVYGIESDLGWMDLSKKVLLTGTASGTMVGIQSGLYGDVTGRLGVTVNPTTLIYAKGGWAFYDGRDFFSTVTGSFSGMTHTGLFSGWTLGGGIEWALGSNWTAKLEYLHFDFGHENYTVFNAGGTPFRFRESVTADTVKVGLNWKFSDWGKGPVSARY
jgi:outer membrane immunogenic protein